METEIIDNRLIENYGTRLERKNLRQFHRSLSRGSICRAADSFVVEILPDLMLIIRRGWREAMREAAKEAP